MMSTQRWLTQYAARRHREKQKPRIASPPLPSPTPLPLLPTLATPVPAELDGPQEDVDPTHPPTLPPPPPTPVMSDAAVQVQIPVPQPHVTSTEAQGSVMPSATVTKTVTMLGGFDDHGGGSEGKVTNRPSSPKDTIHRVDSERSSVSHGGEREDLISLSSSSDINMSPFPEVTASFPRKDQPPHGVGPKTMLMHAPHRRHVYIETPATFADAAHAVASWLGQTSGMSWIVLLFLALIYYELRQVRKALQQTASKSTIAS